MESKNKFIIIGILVIVAVSVAAFLYKEKSPSTEISQQEEDAMKNFSPETFFDVNSNAEKSSVEALQEGDASKETTTPTQTIYSFNSGKNTKVMIYEIKGENGSITPNEFVLEKGASLQIDLVATDADYAVSFSSPIDKVARAKKGERGFVGFVLDTEGRYEFSCTEGCSEKIKGTIIIK